MPKKYTSSPKSQPVKEASIPPAGPGRLHLSPQGVGVAGQVPVSPPCLFSNNAIEITENPSGTPDKPDQNAIIGLCELLSPYHKKQAHYLYSNVSRLISFVAQDLDHVGFLTLTFQENVTDAKEAYRRFNSFRANFLAKNPEFKEWLMVKERQKRGAWHYHMIINLRDNIKAGFDFKKYAEWCDSKDRFRKPCPTGNKELRSLWSKLKEAMAKYKFGKVFALEPVRSNSEAMSRYVGKYISKHIGQREPADRGVRLVSSSTDWAKCTMQFAWFNENATSWRQKVAKFAKYHGCQEFYQLADKLGPRWAYKYADDIYNIEEIIIKTFTENPGLEIPQFQDKTLSRITDNRKIRESQLNLVSRKSDRQKVIAKTKEKARRIISPDNMKEWLNEEKQTEMMLRLETEIGRMKNRKAEIDVPF